MKWAQTPVLLLLLCSAFLGLSEKARAAGPAIRRIALIVGANAPPPGRQSLRFAYDDAKELATVLEQVGGFSSTDLHVLFDPQPTALLAELDALTKTASEAGGDVLFVFYYSGHSDGQALFPHGEPMVLATLRERIERLRARIRIGILDTCHGGAWTQSKGLSLGPPLATADLMNTETEGTALVSSSSGLENAHETDAVRGSFFTHYLVAGLRGAADRAGDGNITLQEAFDYARDRTVRDSARLASSPQHPSFDIALRGRQDIVLSVLPASTSAMKIMPPSSPLEIIQLPTGVTVADAPARQGPVRIALPPGRYLVRSVVDGRVYAKEMEVHAGETVTLADGQLEAVGNEHMALKGGDAPEAGAARSTASGPWIARSLTLPPFGFSADVALGVGQSTSVAPNPKQDVSIGTRKAGAALNLEAALGLPRGFEIGVRFGVRFGSSGALTHADAYGRLYDSSSLHINEGTYSFANPELRVRESLVDGNTTAVGFEARLTPGFAEDSPNVVTLGVPLRFRVPGWARIDTGAYVPIAFSAANTWGLELPLSLWMQRGDWFAGVLSGLYWNNPAAGPDRDAGVPSQLDIHAGLALGYTLFHHFDVKVQLVTTRANHDDIGKYIAGGVGLGVIFP